jgi:peptidoglycan hydrolase-like protein with peptidoglycan-binding domain
MTAKYMRVFENPADQSQGAINYRVSLAQKIYDEFAGTTPAPTPDPGPQGPDTPTTPYWPPRMLCEGMQGTDVSVLQALLQSHGYQVEITGIFDNRTKAMVLAFQGENGLATDGIAGPKTFRALGVST